VTCPLCFEDRLPYFKTRKHKPHWDYFRCPRCSLVIRDPETWPELKQERQRYQGHENDITDPGYRKFLSSIIAPLKDAAPPPSALLDFGCGPSPALGQLLTEEGYDVSLFDPAFYNHQEIWSKRYKAICSTEVLEHLHHPGKEMEGLIDSLEPGGVLAFMTQPVPDSDFESWHYLSDLTHVVFYSKKTMEWIARHWKGSLVYHRKDVFILQF